MTLGTGPALGWPSWSEAAPVVRSSAGDVPRLLLLAWAALLLNVLTPGGASTILPVPYSLNQVIAQGSLLVALVLALLVNPRIVVRPNIFLGLLTVMAVMALVVGMHSEFPVGSTYRAVRLTGFVSCLWLLSPWWGRRDMMLLRVHRICLWFAVGSVVLGTAIAPGKAFANAGRLSGTVWPMPAPQVAHYAAVLFGTSALLWMCRTINGRHALVGLLVSAPVLVATHTRTALLATVVGLAVAAASLFLGHARVRHTSATVVAVGIVTGALFASQITAWLARGQSAEDASQLTGRTKVWSASVAEARPRLRELFGNGLSNKSFNGLPVDSNWVATYLDLGWFGIGVQAAFFLLLIAMAVTHVRGPRRAVALFLISYCLVASVTEFGTGDASTYLLDLTVAAALLATQPGHRMS